jgi:hypothetical protein
MESRQPVSVHESLGNWTSALVQDGHLEDAHSVSMPLCLQGNTKFEEVNHRDTETQRRNDTQKNDIEKKYQKYNSKTRTEAV